MRKLHGLLSSDEQKEMYPMHMPGHKRNPSCGGGLPVGEDITEVEGFDNLHERTGVLGELADRFAKLYHAGCTYPLVNGSTCGILAAVRALTKYGERVLVARNCHRSVYHAIELCGLHAEYLLPRTENGIFLDVTADEVRTALNRYPDIGLVVLTSPTYEGVVSDIREISGMVHECGAKLLVDAAHGAHFGFSPAFPENPYLCGADAVVLSLHKTLPSLTQTALLVAGKRFSSDIGRELAVFETSSPSYLLLESMENCAELLETEGERLFGEYVRRLKRFRAGADLWKSLRLWRGGDCFDFDCGKLVILTDRTHLNGPGLARMLRSEYRIETEMAYPGYLICMTSVADTDEGFDRLAAALGEIDEKTAKTAPLAECTTSVEDSVPSEFPYFLPNRVMTSAEAHDLERCFVPLDGSLGRVLGEYVFAYPPGIPLGVPGEVIDERFFSAIRVLWAGGVTVKSTTNALPEKILVLPQENS